MDRALRALDTPLLRLIAARPLESARPELGIAFDVTVDTENAVGALHGGVISTVLDVVAYMALAPDLDQDEEAITHALFISYQRGATAGDQLAARGRVVRRTRRIAFVASELTRNGDLLATAQVTKSIVSVP